MNTLAQAPMTEAVTMWTVIVAALGVISTLGLQIISIRRDRQNREQDRLDKKLEWEITMSYRDGLVAKVDKNTQVNLAAVRSANLAVKTSNGIKRDLIEKGVKLITDEPIKTEVVNLPEHPIPTVNQEQ